MNQVFAWPVGQEGSRPKLRYPLAFLLASVSGGGGLGFLLAGVSEMTKPMAGPAPRAIVSLIAFCALLLEILGHMGFFPQRRRQVPRRWLAWGSGRSAVAFGLTLGFGVLTPINHAAAFLLLAAIALRGSPLLGLVVGLVFGLVRGAVPLTHRLLVSDMDLAARLQSLLGSRRFEFAVRTSLASLGVVLLIDMVSAH